MTIPNVITQQAELVEFVDNISSSPWLALDTEFMRESSYYPELCLIQIATENISACIDVLRIDHVDPLIEILKQQQQVKIFHSCRQDLEVFYATYKFIPQPIFDTQIAASIIGLDEQISYAELVAHSCAIELAKTESRTDWKKRPLTDAQIDYALDDVNHLGALYVDLSDALDKNVRHHWLSEECQQLINPSHYFILPEDAWKQVKGLGKLNAQQFYYLRNIAQWRETHAQEKNLPRRWLLPDPAILELCQLNTCTVDTINACLKEQAPKSQRHSKILSDILQRPIPDNLTASLPAPEDNRLSKQQRQLIKTLMEVTRSRASEINTSPSLLANRKSLVNLVLGKPSKVLSGWRKQEIADALNSVIQASRI